MKSSASTRPVMNRRDFSRLMLGAAGLATFAPGSLLAAARKPGRTVGLSIGTYGMKDLATVEALKLVRDTGYDGVQLCIWPGWPTDATKMTAADRRTLRKQVEDSGLALPSLLESVPLQATAEKKAKNLDRLKRAVEFGNDVALGQNPYLDTILGRKKGEWEKVKHDMADELRTWVPVLENGKTTLTFKPHAGDAVQSAERALWLINEVGSPHIRIVYDYSHFYIEGFGLEESLHQLIAYAPMIVVKDSKGTSEKHDYLLPGDGKTDYLAYFRLLKELKYSGFVNVEVSGHIHKQPGYQAVPTVKLCYERLAPLMDQAGLERPTRPTMKA